MLSQLPRPVGELLRSAATERDWSTPLAEVAPAVCHRAPERLLAAARAHRVAPALHLSLRGLSLPARLAEALRADHLAGVAAHLQGLTTVRLVDEALGAAGVPWLVFKGPVLSEASYPRADLRWYSDVDLLVAPADLGAAVETLEIAGCEVLDRNWGRIENEQIGELHLLSPHGGMIDLHHDLVYSRRRRERFAIDAVDALRRAASVDLGGRRCPAFDPVDALLHLAVHAALSGGHRLGWLMDIDQSVRRRPPQWQLLCARAQEWQVAPVAHLMLDRCRRTLGTQVPPEVLLALSGRRSWRAVVTVVHTLDPLERTTDRRSPSALLARAGAGDVSSTVTGAVATLRATRLGTAPAPAPGPRDLTNPSSVFFGERDDVRRDQFFRRLAQRRSVCPDRVHQRSGDDVSNPPRVTIGLPVYNGADCLDRSVRSLLAQDFTDFELVISDNASTDATEEMCRGYAREDARVRYHRSPVNRGLAWNWNRLVPLARGELFKWAAADDEHEPTYLSRTVAALDADPTAVLAHSRTVDIDENSVVIAPLVRTVRMDAPTVSERFTELSRGGYPCVQIFGLTRIEALRRTGLHGAYPRSDRVLLAELGLHGRLIEVEEVLFRRREFPNRITRTHSLRSRYPIFTGEPVTGRVFPAWRLVGGFGGALLRAPLPLRQRLECIPGLARAVVSNRPDMVLELAPTRAPRTLRA